MAVRGVTTRAVCPMASLRRVSGLVRSNLVVASGTAVSRITGLGRVLVLAWVVGQNSLSDAYKLANETPNIIYDLLIGGVLSATLVPVFTRLAHQESSAYDSAERQRIRESRDAVITMALSAIAVVTMLAVIAAPAIFAVYSLTPSPDVDIAAFREVGVLLTRVFCVQILFYGISGIAAAALQARRRFAAAAWSPAAANLVIVAALLALPGAGATARGLGDVLDNPQVRWLLAGGATGGIAVMALIVAAVALRHVGGVRPRWRPHDPEVRRILAMGGWTIGFVATNQIALIVIRNLAEPGSSLASAYFDAFTWFVLPHGLLAVSVATTFQPELARAVTAADPAAFRRHFTLGVRAVAALTLPASLLLVVLADPLIAATMERGLFDASATANTADALRGLAIGLSGFSVYLFSLRGFYAHGDTRTPFVLNATENTLNIVLAVLLVGPLGVFGLGLSLAIAYLSTAVIALVVAQQRLGAVERSALATTLGPLVTVTIAAAAPALLSLAMFDSTVVTLLIGGIGGVACAVASALLTDLVGLRSVLRDINRGRSPDHRGE